jgi:hypothetical protein
MGHQINLTLRSAFNVLHFLPAGHHFFLGPGRSLRWTIEFRRGLHCSHHAANKLDRSRLMLPIWEKERRKLFDAVISFFSLINFEHSQFSLP